MEVHVSIYMCVYVYKNIWNIRVCVGTHVRMIHEHKIFLETDGPVDSPSFGKHFCTNE